MDKEECIELVAAVLVGKALMDIGFWDEWKTLRS